jgi:DNA-directed RNA polymerase subunit N (RpoN/RPB10)
MYPYIRCFCGRSIGDIYNLFKELKRREIAKFMKEKNLNTSPEFLPISSDMEVPLNDVFKQLHVNTQCCRARLLSQVEFSDLLQ